MPDLSTTYLGLRLANPVMLSASGLSAGAEGVKRAAEAGAGAVVLRSLFEEQLIAEAGATPELEASHPEAAAFLSSMAGSGGSGEYLDLIAKAKASCRVPVVASVNCVGKGLWADFAVQAQAAGADALELNIGLMPRSPQESGKSVEDRTVAIVKAVSAATELPLAVKLGPGYSNVAEVVSRIADAGAQGVVLFNRFYRMDVDLKKMALRSGPAKSGPADYHEALRWIALLYGNVLCQFAAGTGVHSGETGLKLVAAGATAVEVCSAVYATGYAALGRIVSEMDAGLKDLGIASLDDLRGRLSARSLGPEGAASYERLQYVKALSGTV